ncbi:hypothetical protein KKA86_06615 [bacterium]|nr:hypothetical protein [bacterium]
MQHTSIKIDFGVRIITLGSIAIAISAFVRQNNAQADTFLFILSGMFFLISGSSFLITNFLLSGDKDVMNDVIEKRNDKLEFLPPLFIKRGCFVFAISRIFCTSFLAMGVVMFFIASVNLFDVFGNMRSLPSHLYWIFISVGIIITIFSMFQPNVYKDFE